MSQTATNAITSDTNSSRPSAVASRGRAKTVVTLACSLGFRIDQVEDEESGDLVWRWLATGGLVDLFEASDDAETEQIGFTSAMEAARQALEELAACAEFCADAY